MLSAIALTLVPLAAFADVGWVARPSPPAPAESPIGGLYFGEIRDAARRHGVSEALIFAVIRYESDFDPFAVSRKGARGLMHLMPDTARSLGVRDAFDPIDNIDGGVRHLRGLLDRFDDNVALALAAYNAGERAVATYGGVPPYPETREYVRRVLGLFRELTRDRVFEVLADSTGVTLVNDRTRGPVPVRREAGLDDDELN